MVYCYCNYGGVDITGWHHLVSSATAWGKLEFSRPAGSVDYFRCRCSGWSGRNPMGFSEIVPVKPSNTEPMIWFHGCAAIFNQAIPPYQAESPLLASNMFCTYNYCCLNGLVNSFHFFDCFGVTLSFLRMPYLPIFTKGSLGYLSSMYFSTSLVLGEVAAPFPETETRESRTETGPHLFLSFSLTMYLPPYPSIYPCIYLFSCLSM